MDRPSPDRSLDDPAALEKNLSEGNRKEFMETEDVNAAELSSIRSGEDILGRQDLDPVLNRKMHLVNDVSSPSVV